MSLRLQVDNIGELFIIYNKNIFIRFYSDKDCTAIANNYSTSSIREWLNDDFYNTAFSSYEQAQIKAEKIKTGRMYEGISTEIDLSDAEITEDMVFLLSSSDLLNKNYFFYSPYVFPGDISPECRCIRTATATEYAVCQGLTFTSAESYMNSWNIRKNESDIDKEILSKTDELDGVYFSNYLIRTKPKFYLTQYPNIIDVGFSDSAGTYLSPVNYTGFGVRPIIRLNLDNKSVTRIDMDYDKSRAQYDIFIDIMNYVYSKNKTGEEKSQNGTSDESTKTETVVETTYKAETQTFKVDFISEPSEPLTDINQSAKSKECKSFLSSRIVKGIMAGLGIIVAATGVTLWINNKKKRGRRP